MATKKPTTTKKPSKEETQETVIKSLREENARLHADNRALNHQSYSRYNQYYAEQQRRVRVEGQLADRFKLVEALAERLAVAEGALAQRKEEGARSQGMTDHELHMLVLCVTYRASIPAFTQVDPLSMLYLRSGGIFPREDREKSPLAMQHALEAEFLRRGMIDPSYAAEGILKKVKADEAARLASLPPLPNNDGDLLTAEFERGVEAGVMTGHNADSRDVERALRIVRLKERERRGETVTEEEWEATNDA